MSFIDRIVSSSIRPIAQLRYHLWSDGMMYQGAMSGLQRLSSSLYASMYSAHLDRVSRSPGSYFQYLAGSLRRAASRSF